MVKLEDQMLVKQFQQINVSILTAVFMHHLLYCHMFIMVIIARVITIITWRLGSDVF